MGRWQQSEKPRSSVPEVAIAAAKKRVGGLEAAVAALAAVGTVYGSEVQVLRESLQRERQTFTTRDGSDSMLKTKLPINHRLLKTNLLTVQTALPSMQPTWRDSRLPSRGPQNTNPHYDVLLADNPSHETGTENEETQSSCLPNGRMWRLRG